MGAERYFEITLQLADKYATKYNRLTVYSKIDVSSNYSIQVGCAETEILLWERPSRIKVITNWRVSIEPAALNKLSKIVGGDKRLSSKYNEYVALMDFIDLRDERFNELIDSIYNKTNTQSFKDVLLSIHNNFSENSTVFGKNTIRYALIKLREELTRRFIAGRH